MKNFEVITPVTVMKFDELSLDDQNLVSLARDATYHSYAPFSRFCVGAAIMLSNGEIVTGSNQENVAFPSGTCAERTAAFYAHSQYPDATFVTIAIAARGTDGQPLVNPISPCGACRQSLLEFENIAHKEVKVILVGHDDIYVLPSIKSLLPLAFTEL
ncbi:MAG: cytidine deaminase [Lachnoclostridium sp.]|nr:cytidine deaminase [Lachnoclostridium sp.]